MNPFTRFALAAGAAGVLVGCAQPVPTHHGMMMEQMSMMGDSANMSTEMKAMMADCMQHMQHMQHMQAMSSPRNATPSDAQTR